MAHSSPAAVAKLPFILSHGGERAQGELPPEDRSRNDDLPGRGPSRSTRDRMRRSNTSGTSVPAVPLEAPGGLVPHKSARLDQRREPFLQEQRVALDAFAHGVDDRVVRSGADEGPGQRPFGLFGQGGELDPVQRAVGVGLQGALEIGYPRVGLGAPGGEQQQGAISGQCRQFLGEPQRYRVGPVQVLQDQHRRPSLGQAAPRRRGQRRTSPAGGPRG